MGALLAVQIRTQETAGAALGGRRGGPVFGLLAAAQDQLRTQQEQIRQLQDKLTKYENAAASEQALLKVMNDELQSYKMSLGLTGVKGPGIVLTIDDSPLRLGDGKNPELGQLSLVHSSDLLEAANELWAAGAEAIAIGGQRLTARSSIRCVGPVIHINGIAVPAPYTVSAIGDPKVLTSALNLRDGLLDTMRLLNFKVKLVQQEEIILPALTVQLRMEFAKVVIEQKRKEGGSPR
jgi:uncharacterized protein YlxW (UPF0749 family)